LLQYSLKADDLTEAMVDLQGAHALLERSLVLPIPEVSR
jgi:hypothetical protein